MMVWFRSQLRQLKGVFKGIIVPGMRTTSYPQSDAR